MKTIVFFLVIIFSGVALAEDQNDYFKFVYHGFDFYIPEAPKSAGFLGSPNKTIIVKYGDAPGEKLVGFSVENEMETGECEPEFFFREVLGEVEAGCGELAVESFRRVFVDDRETGVWSGERYDFYYFFGNKRSTIFFASEVPDKAILKVDSNFLTKNQIKRAFKAYLK